ncbi:MAG: AAA family ATPase [Clostridiaceae bacterium]|nr:AAA family ATPase [Clostridiaceae bacterium]
MIIERIKINAFGKLHDYELDLGAGAYLLVGHNEWGKSTVLNFIRAMLYGLGDNRSKDVRRRRDTWLPWSGRECGGEMLLSASDGTRYTIQRIFGKTPSLDRTTLAREFDSEPIDLGAKEPGEYILGISQAAFTYSAFTGQLESPIESDDVGRADIKQTLAQSGNAAAIADDINAHQVRKRLEEAMRSLRNTRNSGELPDLEAALREAQREQTEITAVWREYDRALERLSAVEVRRGALEATENNRRRRVDYWQARRDRAEFNRRGAALESARDQWTNWERELAALSIGGIAAKEVDRETINARFAELNDGLDAENSLIEQSENATERIKQLSAAVTAADEQRKLLQSQLETAGVERAAAETAWKRENETKQNLEFLSEANSDSTELSRQAEQSLRQTQYGLEKSALAAKERRIQIEQTAEAERRSFAEKLSEIRERRTELNRARTIARVAAEEGAELQETLEKQKRSHSNTEVRRQKNRRYGSIFGGAALIFMLLGVLLVSGIINITLSVTWLTGQNIGLVVLVAGVLAAGGMLQAQRQGKDAEYRLGELSTDIAITENSLAERRERRDRYREIGRELALAGARDAEYLNAEEAAELIGSPDTSEGDTGDPDLTAPDSTWSDRQFVGSERHAYEECRERYGRMIEMLTARKNQQDANAREALAAGEQAADLVRLQQRLGQIIQSRLRRARFDAEQAFESKAGKEQNEQRLRNELETVAKNFVQTESDLAAQRVRQEQTVVDLNELGAMNEKRLGELSATFGVDVVPTLIGGIAAKTDLRRLLATRWQEWQNRLSSLTGAETHLRRELEESSAAYAEILERVGSEAALEEKLRDLATEMKATAADEAMPALETAAEMTAETATDKTAEMTVQQIAEQLNRAEAELDAAAQAVRGNREDRIALESALSSRFENLPDPDENERRILELEEDIEEAASYYATLQQAVGLLDTAQKRMDAELNPMVSERASEYMAILTAEKYNRVSVDQELGASIHQDEYGERTARLFSSGTLDQVYLALRLSMATLINADEPLPILLDDPLVQYDPQRETAAFALLSEIAAAGQQIVLLTCREPEELPSGWRKIILN